VVAAIIAVLVALLTPTFLNARVSARKSECVAFLHQIHVATEMYRSDHDGSGKYGDATTMGLPPWPTTRGVPALSRLRCSVAAERKDRVLGTGYFTYFAQPELDLLVPSWEDYSNQYRDASMLWSAPIFEDILK
jgi:type II secretory pathway pseudopilin PulG